jgi:serine/threonine-protein kinase
MSETPPPRDPREPDPTAPDPPEDETIVAGDWPVRPEGEVFVEQTETETTPPTRKAPVIWPWLLALLVLVLAGLGAYFYFSQDDDDPAATPATTTTATAPIETSVEQVRVPDVVGTTSSEATATLRDAGFEANVVPVPSDLPSGQIVAQSPAAGSDAPEGSTVRLNVAQRVEASPQPTTTSPPPATTGPVATAPTIEPSTVPDVVGDELADAARAFGDEVLKVSVQYVPSNEPQGRVVAQAQPGGTQLEQGDTVQVNVSNGPDPGADTQVPDAVGLQQAVGRERLSRAGFEVLAIEVESNRTGEVVSQSPAAGSLIPRGSLVLLYVAAPD